MYALVSLKVTLVATLALMATDLPPAPPTTIACCLVRLVALTTKPDALSVPFEISNEAKPVVRSSISTASAFASSPSSSP